MMSMLETIAARRTNKSTRSSTALEPLDTCHEGSRPILGGRPSQYPGQLLCRAETGDRLGTDYDHEGLVTVE